MNKLYTATLRTKEVNNALTDYVLKKRGAVSGNYSTKMVTTASSKDVVIKLTIRELKSKPSHRPVNKGERNESIN